MDLDPSNDLDPACKARERVANLLIHSGQFTTRIAFAVVQGGEVYFADAFEYTGGGQFKRDRRGIRRLFRVGSTTKAITAVAAKVLEEQSALHLSDFVDDKNAHQASAANGERTLRQLLSHQGAFRLDLGALHLFCYPGDLLAFWAEPNEQISPEFDSTSYGNLGGGYQYSAFNYSLAGAYLAHRTGESFSDLVQSTVFDRALMCSAMFDGDRAAQTVIAGIPGVSQSGVMHVGPTINLQAPTDPKCEDNYYSSDVLPGDPYTWLYYRLNEADSEARDPAGGAIASIVDMAHFARALLDSYHGRPGALLSAAGVRELWGARSDLGCGGNCPYEPFYGIGFFTDSQPGAPVQQVGHGGSRAGYSSALVIRPEQDRAVVILANSDISTVTLSNTAKLILDDFQ